MSLPPVTRTQQDRRAQKALRDLKTELGTWQAVSKALGGINRGLLYDIANGKKPAPNSILKALGLPLKHMLAPVCPVCGIVHVSKRCPTKRKASNGPRFSRKQSAAKLLGLLWGGKD